jgi:VanZ family protein
MKKWLAWIPTLIWMVMIFGVSSRTSLHTSPVFWLDFIIKKSAHVTEYFMLNLLLNYSLVSTVNLSRKKRLLLAFIMAIFYAATDELHQTFVIGREGRIRDVLIDSIGILLSAKFLTFFPLRQR